uniref:IPT/TIG domain-containing protein n=1 Tax=Nonomuraea sp. CA-251285 TaxID=3240002 RepID=UPI003F4928E3
MTLVKGDGTPLAKVPGGTVLESVPETDPKIRVKIKVYDATVPDGTKFPAKRTQLIFNAGQVIRQSTWDKRFPLPEVESVTPATGPAAGGTALTIMGKNFTPATTVEIDGVAATSVVVVTPTMLTCVSPAGSAGAVDVEATTAAGAGTLANGFTYTA